MTVEDDLRVGRDAIKAMNDRDWKRFDELHAQSLIVYAAGMPEPTKGRDPHREYAKAFVEAFPDFRFDEERAFGQDGWIVQILKVSGTHKGVLKSPQGQEIPPTSRPVSVKICALTKVEGGQITEEHHFWNTLDLLTQIGMAPPM